MQRCTGGLPAALSVVFDFTYSPDVLLYSQSDSILMRIITNCNMFLFENYNRRTRRIIRIYFIR